MKGVTSTHFQYSDPTLVSRSGKLRELADLMVHAVPDTAHTRSDEHSSCRVKSAKLSYGSPQMLDDSQWHSPTPFRASGLASQLIVQPDLSPKRKDPHSTQEHVATGTPLQGLRNAQSQVDSTSPREYDTGTRAELLELYITEKKQSYLHYLQQRTDISRQRERDARDYVEEQIVEIELADSGRSTLSTEACAVQRHGDASYIEEACEVPETYAIAPLELEASTLLELLPPLRRSNEETPDTAEIGSKQCPRIPRYYPYLAPKLPEDIQELRGTRDGSDDTRDGCRDERTQSHNIQTRHARVVAFHNAGYGMGYVDFEACSDWICLPKRSKA
jgi:hypothetical protein